MKLTIVVLVFLTGFGLVSCKKAPAKCALYHTETDKDPELGGTTGDTLIDTYVISVNSYRVARGKGRMYWSSALAAVAAAHVLDMATNDFFNHVGTNGKNPAERVSAANLFFVATGENLLSLNSPATANQVLSGWQNSPQHNATILDSQALGWVFHGVARRTNVAGTPTTGSCPAGTTPCDLFAQLFWNPGCVP